VQDDEVVYASGFGVRGGRRGDDADTHMMIGSTGKTITTMLMAAWSTTGCSTGTRRWSRCCREFAVADPELTESMVMWHLVCACSGVPRRDLELLFNADEMTAEDVVESLATFEFFTDFGEVFQYSNQLVGTGGYAAAAATAPRGASCGRATPTRSSGACWQPIGMPNTTLSFDRGDRARRARLPHQLDLDTGAYARSRWTIERLLLPIAPAGSHWSTATTWRAT
jgi:CubicO group peptidase (beta-lactamase class C family)